MLDEVRNFTNPLIIGDVAYQIGRFKPRKIDDAVLYRIGKKVVQQLGHVNKYEGHPEDAWRWNDGPNYGLWARKLTGNSSGVFLTRYYNLGEVEPGTFFSRLRIPNYDFYAADLAHMGNLRMEKMIQEDIKNSTGLHVWL